MADYLSRRVDYSVENEPSNLIEVLQPRHFNLNSCFLEISEQLIVNVTVSMDQLHQRLDILVNYLCFEPFLPLRG
jgi:hypothetical protein